MAAPSDVKPIPDGYHSITPYLYVRDGAAALEFYRAAFGAEELCSAWMDRRERSATRR